MTTIPSAQVENFVRSPPPALRFFLIHGGDEGLVYERATSLSKAILAGNSGAGGDVTRIDAAAVSRDPGRLADEVQAVSLFGGHRVIWLDVGGRDLTSQIEPLLARPPEHATLIVEAGNLKKGAPLRALFEQSRNAASIECHADDRSALLALIEAEAARANLRVTPEAREYLLSAIGSERQSARSDVAKAMLYALGGESLSLEDVQAIFGDDEPSDSMDPMDHALEGKIREVGKSLDAYFRDGGDVGYLLIRLSQRLILLHSVRLEIDRGASPDTAARNAQFRLAPSARASFSKQVGGHAATALGARLAPLARTIAQARRETRLANAIATRTLWSLAGAARPKR